MTKDNLGNLTHKVLITGSTANQCNPVTHSRSTNFAGLMEETLSSSGIDVSWGDPDLTMDLSMYEKVVVGISSPLALGSNRIYGALNVISQLWGDSRLVLFLDAPDPNNVKRGLESVGRNPKSLTKDFFSYRKDFDKIKDPRVRVNILRACEALRDDQWPTTIFPEMPGVVNSRYVEEELPVGARGAVNLMNLDYSLFNRFVSDPSVHRELRWMAEHTGNKKWLRAQELRYPILGLRTDYRRDLHAYYEERLRSAFGFLHLPSKKSKAWWSPKIAMSLALGTPVFSGEPLSSSSSVWNLPPRIFESFSTEARIAHAAAQYEAYLDLIPDESQAKAEMLNSIGLVTTTDVQQGL